MHFVRLDRVHMPRSPFTLTISEAPLRKVSPPSHAITRDLITTNLTGLDPTLYLR